VTGATKDTALNAADVQSMNRPVAFSAPSQGFFAFPLMQTSAVVVGALAS
jgi:hypothetical protein